MGWGPTCSCERASSQPFPPPSFISEAHTVLSPPPLHRVSSHLASPPPQWGGHRSGAGRVGKPRERSAVSAPTLQRRPEGSPAEAEVSVQGSSRSGAPGDVLNNHAGPPRVPEARCFSGPLTGLPHPDLWPSLPWQSTPSGLQD